MPARSYARHASSRSRRKPFRLTAVHGLLLGSLILAAVGAFAFYSTRPDNGFTLSCSGEDEIALRGSMPLAEPLQLGSRSIGSYDVTICTKGVTEDQYALVKPHLIEALDTSSFQLQVNDPNIKSEDGYADALMFHTMDYVNAYYPATSRMVKNSRIEVVFHDYVRGN